MLNTKDTYPERKLFFYFLFAITIIITLIPFFKIGLTNCDDLEYYVYTLMGKTNATGYAHVAGRFYFLFTKPIYHIAYLVDNFYFTKILHYGFLLLSFVLFTVVINKLFKQTAFAVSVLLLLFAFLTVTSNNFIPTIAFPVYFTLSFSIFMGSLLLLIKYYENKKNKHLIFSVILAAIALLFYENYLMFIFFVFIFILAKHIREHGLSFIKNKTFYKESLPFVLVCLVYVTIYFLYRLHIQTEEGFYQGSSLAKDFSFSNFFRCIWSLNRMAFPTSAYFSEQTCIELNSLLVAGHQRNFWYILSHSQPLCIINAVIQCFLFCVLFGNLKPTISWKKIGIGAITAATFTFAVHILIGVTEKYNAVYYQMEGYVTTYYSCFCIALLIALLAYTCLKLSYKNKYVKIFVIAVFALLLFGVSIIIGYNNDHLSRDWQHSHGKHILMEKLLEEGIFDEISDDEIIYLDNYSQSSSRLGRHQYTTHLYFWSDYIQAKLDREMNIVFRVSTLKEKLENQTEQEFYYIKKYEALKTSDILLVFAKINSNSIHFENEDNPFEATTATEATFYYYSANKSFVFQFVIPEYSRGATVTIDNQEIKATAGINAITIDNQTLTKAITSFTLKSEAPFLVKNFAISNIGLMNGEVFDLEE